jgi:hypothetical protein
MAATYQHGTRVRPMPSEEDFQALAAEEQERLVGFHDRLQRDLEERYPHEGVRVTNIRFGYRMDEDATEVEYEGWATIGRSMRRGRGASQDNEEEAWQRMLGQLLDA